MNNKFTPQLLSVIFPLLIGSFAVSVEATDYYFDDTAGDNSWTGTSEIFIGGSPSIGPWQTLDQLRSFSASTGFQPGDRILFKRGGTFPTRFSVNIESSGDPLTEQYIELSAYGSGAKPILELSGQAVVNSTNNGWVWTDQGSGIWFYNYTGLTVDGLWRDGVFLKHASDQTLSNGDFYWDKTTGIYYRSPDNSPNDDNLFRGGTGYGFGVGSLSYVRFKDLHFATGPTAIGGGATSTTPINNIVIEDCEFNDFGTAIFVASRLGQNNHDITVENNTFTRNGRSIYFTSLNGIEKSININIKNNHLSDNDTNGNYELFTESMGTQIDIESISMQNGNSSFITDNVVQGGSSEGAIIIWTNPDSETNNNVIARNVLHDITGAGINLFGSNIVDTHQNNIVHNNLIYNCSDGGGIRLSANDSAGSNFIYNNTIVNCGNSYFLNGLSAGFTFFNNISLNPTGHHIEHGGGTLQSVMGNNIYYPDTANSFRISATDLTLAQWRAYTGQDITSVVIDPLLADINTEDFHLTSSSPAIDAATPVGLTADIEYNPILALGKPDIGAYEFGHNDSDGDGVIDYDEICFDGDCQNYNPYDAVNNPSGGDINISVPDTDGDGSNDGDEIVAGTDPLNASSTPAVSAPAMGLAALVALWIGIAVFGVRFRQNAHG